MSRLSFSPLVLALTLLAGCGQQEPATSPAPTASAGDTAAASPAADAAAGFAALQANERMQGTLELDLGTGLQRYRSVATVVDANLGAVAAERLATADGQAALDRANAQTGGKVTVNAAQVQELANAMAGKTFAQAELREIAIIKTRRATLTGTAADGSQVTLGIDFPLDSDVPTGASLEYIPDGKRVTQSFTSTEDGGPVSVTLERFDAIDARTWRISGHFTSGPLKPGVLAKPLAGQQIDGASGRFDIDELVLKN